MLMRLAASNTSIKLTVMAVAAINFCALSVAHAAPQLESKPATSASTGDFERFRKQTDSWKILNDPQVKSGIRSLMGNKDENYWSCTQLVGEPSVVGNDLFLGATVRGLNGFMNSGLNINLATGKLCVGYLDDQVFHIFGASNEKEVPQQMKDFNHETLSDKKLSFDKPDWTPKKPAVKKPTAKALNLSILTGTYERNESQFVNSTLMVKELPGSKIKFQVQATNGGHTGEASGTAAVKDKIAIHKEDAEGNISMKFNGNKVEISGKDSYFCGMGVSLLGTYIKTDDKVPKFTD